MTEVPEIPLEFLGAHMSKTFPKRKFLDSTSEWHKFLTEFMLRRTYECKSRS